MFLRGLLDQHQHCKYYFPSPPHVPFLTPQFSRLVSSVTAAWLALLGERRSTEREVAGSNPGRTNTQGL